MKKVIEEIEKKLSASFVATEEIKKELIIAQAAQAMRYVLSEEDISLLKNAISSKKELNINSILFGFELGRNTPTDPFVKIHEFGFQKYLDVPDTFGMNVGDRYYIFLFFDEEQDLFTIRFVDSIYALHVFNEINFGSRAIVKALEDLKSKIDKLKKKQVESAVDSNSTD